MKSFVAFLAVILCCIAAICNAEFNLPDTAKECAQKLNVSPDEFKKSLTGQMKLADVTQNMKCVVLCMTEKEGTMKDGVFQVHAETEHITNLNLPNKDALLKGIADCKDLKGVDNCDTAFKIISCIHQKGMQM